MGAASFFQSPEFGEFQEKIPYRGKSWMLGKGGENLCLTVRQKLKFGKSFLWVPYGPITENPEKLKSVFRDLQRIAHEENVIFARIEPGDMRNMPRVHEMFMNCSCGAGEKAVEKAGGEVEGREKDAEKSEKSAEIKLAPERFTPEATLIVDVSLSEEEILRQMKPKGRYNIKVAEKNGVEVIRYDDARDCFAPRFRSGLAMTSDFDAFYKILSETARRDGFHCHPKFFYEEFLKFFGAKKMTSLFITQHGKEVIAGILVVWHGDTAIYYYGASSYEHRNLMAPYLLQWEALKEAKKRGFRWYDFFGIAPENTPNHPWKGVTEFKKKFGGHAVQYAPAFDVVYRPFWYFLYRLKQKFS